MKFYVMGVMWWEFYVREVYGEVLCDWRYVVKFYVMGGMW